MAGWIRLRGDLVESPKVRRAARMILNGKAARALLDDLGGLTIETVRLVLVGALARFWTRAQDMGHFDGADLILDGYGGADIDEISGMVGFTEALQLVGWLKFEDARFDRVRLPNFRQHAVTDELPVTVAAKRPRKKAEPKAERPRNELFDAVAEVTGSDPTTAASHIAKVSSLLAKASPPYTPADVRRFADEFLTHCPYAAKDNRPPTLNEIEKNIGKIRHNPPKKKPAQKMWVPPNQRFGELPPISPQSIADDDHRITVDG